MKRIALFFGLLALVLTGCSSENAVASNSGAVDRTPKVFVTAIKETTFTPKTVLPARIEASVDVDLAAEAQGVLTKKLIEKGDRVVAGQVLLELDDEILKTTVKSAQEQVNYLEGLLRRQEGLLEKKLVSKDVYESTRSQFVAASESLRAAQTRLAKARVVSPVDGVVTFISSDLGEFVKTGSTVANIINIDQVKAIVNIPESEVREISVGQSAVILTESFSAAVVRHDGVVDFVNIKGDPATKTYLAEVLIENAGQDLLPEMIVEVEFSKSPVENAVLIPSSSIVEDKGSVYVYVVEGGESRQVPVRKVELSGGHVLVEGLSVGQMLVVQGQHLVTDGGAVHATEKK